MNGAYFAAKRAAFSADVAFLTANAETILQGSCKTPAFLVNFPESACREDATANDQGPRG